MKKLIIISLLCLLSPSTVFAADSHKGHDHSVSDEVSQDTESVKVSKKSDIEVKVNGMVCDFCARGLEKTFGKVDSVKDITVSLEKGMISINLVDNGKLDDEKITQLIKDNGISVVSIKRNVS